MKRLAAGLVAGALALAGVESVAEACGGCFTPPENPTVVTDHRMVFAVSRDQSTLYDQIRYQGSPSSFAWVLPFAGEIEVGTSSDALFAALDQETQTQIIPPPRNCPPQPSDCARARRATAGSASPEDGVTVLKREVVGPYETVQLKATNPTALNEWLGQNGYNLPDDVKPIVSGYQNEHYNFLALKLVPGQGVQDMRPIRVTTKSMGAQVALPLRMVAAGAGAKVGITLWLVAEGRYAPQNFASFQIPSEALSWDWTTNKSDYTDIRAQRTAENGGRAWEIESSIVVLRSALESRVQFYGEDSYLEPAADGGSQQQVPTERELVNADLAVLFAGIPVGAERITRIRADLDRAALDADLLVTAAADQSVLSNVRNVTKEKNEPICPVWDGCDQDGTAPRSQAQRDSSDGCSLAPNRASPTWLALMLGFFGFSVQRKFRRRR